MTWIFLRKKRRRKLPRDLMKPGGKQSSGEAQLSEKEELSQKEEQSPKEQKPEVMDGFVFYNIMESIVQEKAIKYMKQFGNCTCKRCEADTIALALSKLPPSM